MGATTRRSSTPGTVPTSRFGRASANRGSGMCLGFGTALILLIAAHPLWLPLVGGFLIAGDPPEAADAIVVLGGGKKERVAYGAQLLREGYAPWLIVTNSPLDIPGIRDPYVELMRREAIWQGAPAERILQVPELVSSTVEEARAVRRFVEPHAFHRLIVVTEPYHSRRARWIFQEAFNGSDIQVFVSSVEGSTYEAGTWWRSRDGPLQTVSEYLKLGVFLVKRS